VYIHSIPLIIIMRNKIVYILTWFPMFSESFVYNEIKHLSKDGGEIDTIFVLHQNHDPVDYDLSFLNIRYPASVYRMLSYFIFFLIRHPATICRLIVYLGVIHRGDYFHLRRGYTSFIKGLLLLPLIIWINKQIGERHVHFHAHFAAVAPTVAMVLARLRHTTFSFTGHGTDILEYGPRTLGDRINASSFFITVSEYNKQFIINNFEGVRIEKIHVIPAVVDTDTFRLIRKASDFSLPRDVQIITVARLSSEKGHEVFLRALARFSTEHTDYHYAIIGDGPLKDSLGTLVQSLGIAHRVTFFGFCNHEFILKALSESHLFVLTSSIEGLPVGLMEAAAAGLPILATRITAIPEIIENGINGILVEPGDEEGIYRALKTLSADNWKRLMELSYTSLQHNISHFDMNYTVPKINKLFYGV
jgi:colanic acid/amylovoran biosynthesis glycosyltransferase